MDLTSQEIPTSFVLIPAKKLEEIVSTLNFLKDKFQSPQELKSTDAYITAQEFMDACRIGRSKFDELREENKINVIQKGRKLYLEASEIKRYFKSA